MTVDNILNFLTSGVGPLIKVAILVAIFLYGIFAAIILRQIQIMNKVVEQANFSIILFGIALIHFALVVVLFFVAMLVL